MQIVLRRQCAWSVRSYFLGKIQKISSVCCLLNLPIAWWVLVFLFMFLLHRNFNFHFFHFYFMNAPYFCLFTVFFFLRFTGKTLRVVQTIVYTCITNTLTTALVMEPAILSRPHWFAGLLALSEGSALRHECHCAVIWPWCAKMRRALSSHFCFFHWNEAKISMHYRSTKLTCQFHFYI